MQTVCGIIANMTPVIEIFLLSLLGSVVALIGGVVFLLRRDWTESLEKYSVPFAAGVLLTVALIGLIPEAVHISGDQMYIVVLATFLFSYLFEHFACHLHHHTTSAHHSAHKNSVPLVLIGDTIHNFIDGVAIAASYLVSPGLGLITAISTFLHEVPHEIGDFGILLKAGWSRRWVLLINLFSALSTLLGAALVLVLPQSLGYEGWFLAIAAGMFLYLGASDFLPRIDENHQRSTKSILALLLGTILMIATLKVVPHSHGDDHHQPSEHSSDHHPEENHSPLLHQEEDHD